MVYHPRFGGGKPRFKSGRSHMGIWGNLAHPCWFGTSRCRFKFGYPHIMPTCQNGNGCACRAQFHRFDSCRWHRAREATWQPSALGWRLSAFKSQRAHIDFSTLPTIIIPIWYIHIGEKCHDYAKHTLQ